MPDSKPPRELVEEIRRLSEFHITRLRLHEAQIKGDAKKAAAALEVLRRDAQEQSKSRRSRRSFESSFGELPPWEFAPPYGVPGQFRVPQRICNLNEERNLAASGYWEDESGRGTASGDVATKHANGNVFGQPGTEAVSFGFNTLVNVPAASGNTTVGIRSVVNALFGWAEANTFPGTPASILSSCGLSAAIDGQYYSAPSQTVIDIVNTTPETVQPSQQFGWDVGFGLSLNLTVAPGSSRDIIVTEWAFMLGATSSGFVSMSINFEWAALNVALQEGCRVIEGTRWGYWHGGRFAQEV